MENPINKKSERPPQEVIKRIENGWRSRVISNFLTFDKKNKKQREKYLIAQSDYFAGAMIGINWVEPAWWLAMIRDEDILAKDNYQIKKTHPQLK
jgi:hypothetical protein